MQVQFNGRGKMGVDVAIQQLSKAGYTQGKTDKRTGMTEYVKGDERILVPEKGRLSGTQSTRVALATKAARAEAEAQNLNYFA